MKILKFLVVFLTIFASTTFAYGYLCEKEVISTLQEYYNRTPSILYNNEYTKEINFDFAKLTNNFIAKDKNELKNIYYTVISSGMNEFTFYCDIEYYDCIPHVIEIAKDNDFLSGVNNFINVFNRFYTVKAYYTYSGKVTLFIKRVYNEKDIININYKLDELEKTLYQNCKTEKDKILAIHDYIINNTKYDLDDPKDKLTESKTAIGVLMNNLATCNGYTDTAALLLDRLNIPNLKISNDDHIWNLVYIDDKWLHMDLTWDDPVNKINPDSNILQHDYFLKTSLEYQKLNNEENKHDFNINVYNFVN